MAGKAQEGSGHDDFGGGWFRNFNGYYGFHSGFLPLRAVALDEREVGRVAEKPEHIPEETRFRKDR